MKPTSKILVITLITTALFGCGEDMDTEQDYNNSLTMPPVEDDLVYSIPDADIPFEIYPDDQPASSFYTGLEKLDTTPLDWGPGGPVDQINRSVGALSYQEKYAQHNALFLAEEESVIYLTFDEGYDFGLTTSVLDTLLEKQVKATFFITYDFAKQAPDTVQRMINEGHVVGNHSYTHVHYATIAPQEMGADLIKMHDYVKNQFDYDMEYFRFPAGNFSEQALSVINQHGYKSVFWSFAYKDWITDQQPDPTESLEKLLNALCPGNIYLLHSVSSTNDKILGDFIDGAVSQGYTFGDPSNL